MKERELQKLIRAGAAGDEFDLALHGRIVAALKEFAPSSLSLTTRFQAAGYLQQAVVWLARQNDYKRPSPYAENDFVVDEDKFPEEIGILAGISGTLQYSQAMSEHFAARRKILLQSLNANPIFSVAPPWNTLGARAKLALLKKFMERSVETYSLARGEIKIETSPDTDNPKGQNAHSEFRAIKRADGKRCTEATVKFNEAALGGQTHRKALILAYHESIHIALRQIARGIDNGDIAPGHPLYNDARIKRVSIHFGTPASPLIPSLYESDSEEKLAYSEQDAFIRDAGASKKPAAQP